MAPPLLEALEAKAALPLHLPAHGRGRGLTPALQRLLRRAPGSWDLPELPALGGPLEAGVPWPTPSGAAPPCSAPTTAGSG